MSRISGIDPAAASAPVDSIFAQQKATWGAPLKPYLVYGRRPSIIEGVANMWGALAKSALLPSSLTSLICRRIASINGCVF